MFESLVGIIRIRESSSGVRFVLPRRRDPARLVFASLGAGLSVLFVGFGVGWILLTRGAAAGAGPLFSLLGFVPIVAGVAKLVEAILLVGGHAEVLVRAGRIWAVERCGPIMWWRSRPAERVWRFVLIYQFKIPGTGIDVTGQNDGATEETPAKDPTAAIQVECQGAGIMLLAWDYPSRWLLSLAQDLADHWHELDFSHASHTTRVPIEVIDSASPENGNAATLPKASTLLDRDPVDELSRNAILRPNLEVRVKAELASDERIVWLGQPLPHLTKYLAAIPFGIAWTAFVAGAGHFIIQEFLFDFLPPKDGFDWVPIIFCVTFLLFMIPFGLVGVLLIGAPYWKVIEARRTAYVLTNRRIFSVCPRMTGAYRVSSYTADRLRHLRSVEHSDGSGDLVFSADQSSRGSDEAPDAEAFWSVPGVRNVEALVRKTLLTQ